MTSQFARMRLFLFIIFSAILFTAGSQETASARDLTGAGATFPFPLYSRMFDDYSRRNGVSIRYEAVGSGAGIERIISKKVDFAGSDAFMTEKERKEAGAPVIHIPTCLGAVVITYNLPGNPRLRFTPDLIADIFLGKVNRWNDPKIAALNEGASLPDMGITIIHRADGSGTTFIFSEYLSKVSAEWQRRVGVEKSLTWPVGRGAKGNPGVAGLVNQISGSVGYVELVYALGNSMAIGAVRNKAGKFIEPTTDSVTLSAGVELPNDTQISLTDTSAPEGYPISGFTWLVLYREQNYGGRLIPTAEELAKLLWWITHEGQRHAAMLYYAPLPEEAVAKTEGLLKSLTYGGSRLLP